jgi:hypothetical protein
MATDPYMQQTNDAIMPYWERARKEMKSNLADQGMLSSTGGWKRYSQEVEQPYAQAANTMYADLQKQARAEQFQGQQANVQNAMNLYNLLWSAYLNQVQLRPKKQPKAPMDFPIFGNMYNANYLQPLSSYLPKQAGGPAVSPEGNPEYVPRYQPNLGSIGAERDALAQQEYNKAYLSYLNRQAAESKRQFDITNAAQNPPQETMVEMGNNWGKVTEYGIGLMLEGASSEQAINAALNKFNIPIKPWLDEGSEQARQFIYAMFSDDPDMVDKDGNIVAKGKTARQKADEWIAAHSTRSFTSPAAPPVESAAAGTLVPRSPRGNVLSRKWADLFTSSGAVKPQVRPVNNITSLYQR